MEIRKINDNTICCIITQEDLSENDMDLDDFLEHKPKAMNYLRNVMAEAAQKEDFQLEGPFTTMQVRVLKDQSICLTFTQGLQPDLLNALRGIARRLSEEDQPDHAQELPPDSSREQQEAGIGGEEGTAGEDSVPLPCGGCSRQADGNPNPTAAMYGIVFDSMDAAAKACRLVPASSEQESSLYYDREERLYYLLVHPDGEEALFEKTMLAMNEFGEFMEMTPAEAAYITEHGICILKEKAAQRLRSV